MGYIINPYWMDTSSGSGTGLDTGITSTTWRARIVGCRDIWQDIAEVEMASTIGGTDLCTGGLATSGMLAVPANMFDDNNATYSTANNFFSIDQAAAIYSFPSAVNIQEVRSRVANTFTNRGIDALFLDYWDGSQYVAYAYACDPTPYTANGSKTFTLYPIPTTRAEALIWGIDVTAINGGWLTFDQLYFNATSGGPSLCVNGSQLCDKCGGGGNIPINLFDGTSGTNFYQAGSGVTSGRVWYAFPPGTAAPNPSYATIQAWTANANTDSPKDFTIFYSLDGLTRTTVSTQTGITWTNGQTREFGPF